MSNPARVPSRWRPPGEGTLLPLPDVALRLLGARLRRDDPRMDHLKHALLDGDPLADAVADWMHEAPRGEGRALLDRALERGIDHVPNAPAPSPRCSPRSIASRRGSIAARSGSPPTRCSASAAAARMRSARRRS